MSNAITKFFRSLLPSAPQPMRAKYDLAQTTSENRKHWANADALSSRAALNASVRRLVRMRSRHESENNSWYKGILHTASNHIVGSGGPRLQVLTDDSTLNDRVETVWRYWSKRAAFADMLRLMVETYWRDGEVFVFRAYRQRWYPLPLDLDVLEAEQVSSPDFQGIRDNVDDGIMFDRQTNELLYYIWDQHPGNNSILNLGKGDWYSADRVCHLFRQERPGQVRGIPRATASLSVLPIMRRQEMATLTSAEIAASFSLFLQTNGAAVEPAASTSDFASMEIARGMLTTLPEGWTVNQLDAKHPGPLYQDFQQQTLMSFSRCTNMPYCLAAGTSKDSNFSSMKGDLRQVWEPEVRTEQDRIESKIVSVVFSWFLEDMYHAGMLPQDPRVALIPHQWTWPPIPDVDPIDSANAATVRLKSGLSSLSEEHAKRNLDWATESRRAAADFGVTEEEYRRAVFDSTFDTQPANAVSVTTGDAAVSTIADTAMNGAQVTSIVEIISQVSAGVIPQAAARALILSAFPAVPVQRVDEMLAPFVNVAPTVPGASSGSGGEYTEIGQRAFRNNQKRIVSTLDQFIAGDISRVMAEQTLASIGLTEERITALIDDASDGTVDEPHEEVTT